MISGIPFRAAAHQQASGKLFLMYPLNAAVAVGSYPAYVYLSDNTCGGANPRRHG